MGAAPQFIKGREEHAADAAFSGLTLAQFKTKVKASLDTRAEIENLERELNGWRVDRDNADLVSEEFMSSVVNPVRSNANQGENSTFHA